MLIPQTGLVTERLRVRQIDDDEGRRLVRIVRRASMIRRYIIWRNNHAYDQRLRRIVDRANAA
jgi:hypothetical protein